MALTHLILGILVGCTGDPADKSTGDTSEPTKKTTETGTPTTPTEPTDTSPTGDTGVVQTTITDPQCLQESAVFSEQVQFLRRNVTIDPATLAVTAAAPPPKSPLPEGFDLEEVGYYGAIDPGAPEPWWTGWTILDDIGLEGSLPGGFHPLAAEVTGGTLTGAGTHDCKSIDPNSVPFGFVRFFNEQFPVCFITGRITTDVTWRNDHVYYLVDTVTVGTGDSQLNGGPPTTNVTLTIEPGTQIYAAANPDLQTSLVISRGSKIDARGTRELPIIFSGLSGDENYIVDPSPAVVSVRSSWGGLILSGFGVPAGGNSNGEATATYRPSNANRRFGGLDNTDDSGTLEYVIIAEGGKEFRNNLFVSGLVLEGVGSTTKIDHVQVLSSNGDCIGAFGGAPNVRHIVCSGAGDDNIDVDDGFRGSVQFALIRQGATNGDIGIEADRDASGFTGVYANVTVLGNAGDEGTTRGALHRTGAGGRVFRSVFADDKPAGGAFGIGCLDIDDVLVPELEYRDVLFDCTPTSLVDCEDGEGP